ncbi:MAG: DNA-processing protein DprA [Coriobacteriaceae bacterium]|jgi:DNA processing protein|nr:DNA-processing protein DprA [Coriobacteriaceae bacterium]
MKKLTLEEARHLHRSLDFKRYTGPLLIGPRWQISRGQEGFPHALMGIPDPPDALFGIGDPLALQEGLAVIGARNASPYGMSCTRMFAKRAAEKGIVIISGGARGCDAAAHQAALEASCPTVVFLGGGIDQIYPPQHYRLFQDVIDSGGAVVSEHVWGYPPLKHTFKARNRLIAGLARATLIVEAGIPSGTFSTADEALAAGREVLVVPGSLCSSLSRGTNRLLYQGATPVVDEDSFDDLMFSLFGSLKQQAFPQEASDIPESPDMLLAALSAQPMRIEEMLAVLEQEKKTDGLLKGAVAIGQPRNSVAVEEPVKPQASGGSAQQGKGCREDLMLRLVELQRTGRVARYPDGRYGPVKTR